MSTIGFRSDRGRSGSCECTQRTFLFNQTRRTNTRSIQEIVYTLDHLHQGCKIALLIQLREWLYYVTQICALLKLNIINIQINCLYSCTSARIARFFALSLFLNWDTFLYFRKHVLFFTPLLDLFNVAYFFHWLRTFNNGHLHSSRTVIIYKVRLRHLSTDVASLSFIFYLK